MYDVRYPAGVSSQEHGHDHDSIIYLLSGRLRGTKSWSNQVKP
jgi:quercetin dioxygenase-like cupin family protein